MQPNNKMKNLFCQGCNEVFAIPSGRGRPPRFCSACGGDPDVVHKVDQEKRVDQVEELRSKAKARIDNLEMMLLSRGTHLKQNRRD